MNPKQALSKPPANYLGALHSWHIMAAYVISGVRRRALKKIGLRHCEGGYCAQIQTDDSYREIQMTTNTITDLKDGNVKTHVPKTLKDAAEFLGTEVDTQWAEPFDIPKISNEDEPIKVDAKSGVFLGQWFNFAYQVLEQVREMSIENGSNTIQLWPEHFDFAFEWGDDDDGTKASVGISPADAHDDGIRQPYLYVSLWYPDNLAKEKFDENIFNSKTFKGAILKLDDILNVATTYEDQKNVALEFFKRINIHLF